MQLLTKQELAEIKARDMLSSAAGTVFNDRQKLIAHIEEMETVLKNMLASAHPHPMENGVMYEAWNEAKKVLSK